jgi:hypothetical protein
VITPSQGSAAPTRASTRLRARHAVIANLFRPLGR